MLEIDYRDGTATISISPNIHTNKIFEQHFSGSTKGSNPVSTDDPLPHKAVSSLTLYSVHCQYFIYPLLLNPGKLAMLSPCRVFMVVSLSATLYKCSQSLTKSSKTRHLVTVKMVTENTMIAVPSKYLNSQGEATGGDVTATQMVHLSFTYVLEIGHTS